MHKLYRRRGDEILPWYKNKGRDRSVSKSVSQGLKSPTLVKRPRPVVCDDEILCGGQPPVRFFQHRSGFF